MPGLSGWIGIWNSEEQRKETGRCWDLSLFLKESYKQGLPFAHFLILPSILIYNRCLTHVLISFFYELVLASNNQGWPE